MDALLDGTRGSRFFTRLDLASSYHQLLVRTSDRFLSQLGLFEWHMVPFGPQCLLAANARHEPDPDRRPQLPGGSHDDSSGC
jgi:hypothetical protein